MTKHSDEGEDASHQSAPASKKRRALTRRSWLKTTAGGLLAGALTGGSALASGTPSPAPSVLKKRYRLFPGVEDDYSERAIRLVRESLVIDMLSLFSLDFQGERQKWMSDPDSFTAEDLERFRSSGIDVFHPAVGIGSGPRAYEASLQFLGSWNGFIANQEHLQRVDSFDDFRDVKERDTIGVTLGIQSSGHFRRPDDVDLFYGLGQRVSQLTYNSQNRIAGGSTDRVDGGVSNFGASIIERMNEVGMAVDVSHSGDQTTLDAVELSEAPVLFTHSNCRALVEGHPRTKTDEAIRKMAESGGVMGITGVRNFVSNEEPTTIEDYLDHFDHVANLVGPEHLGVGSDIDLDGYDDMPEEQYKELKAGYRESYGFREKIDIDAVAHPKRMFDLTEGLIERGYSDKEIEGILGGNFERVLSEIWDVPEEESSSEEAEGED